MSSENTGNALNTATSANITPSNGSTPPVTTEAKIEQLRRLRAEAQLGGGQKRIDAQHAKGS